jgi:multidrug efflux system membrane fusion protein
MIGERIKSMQLLRQSIFLLAGVMALAGCKKPTGGLPQQPTPAVTVQKPVEQEVIEWDEYPGRLDAVEMVEVRARVNGYLQSVHFTDGSEVHKGDLLFVIDPRPYQAELNRAEADVKLAQTRLELAQNELARADRLRKSNVISEEESDTRTKNKQQAEAALAAARAAEQTAKLNLDYTQIKSPIDGRIGRKLITEGNLVNSGQGQSTVLTTIVSLDPIYCYFDADEPSVLKYQQLSREGKRSSAAKGEVALELQLANEQNFPHKGKLNFTDNRVDPGTGTLRVRGVLPNPGPDRILQPGFFARLRVPGSPKYRALLIPEESVGTDQGQKFVLVANAQNVVESRKVTLGPSLNGRRVVREGIQAQDRVLVTGLMAARPGMKVQATESNSVDQAAATASAQR